MKNTVTSLLLVLTSILTLSCAKPDPKPTLTNAIITGVDYRKCSCCGGMMITFSNDPVPYSAAFYNIREMPGHPGIDMHYEFPMYVKVKYTKVTTSCGNFVDIKVMEKR